MSSRALRRYLFIVLVGLAVQGLGSLIFRWNPALADASPYLIRGLLGIDAWHAGVHIVWGTAGTVLLLAWRTPDAAIGLALAFGTFYTLFAVLGLAVHHPWGLELDPPENLFHVVVGPTTLVLGWLALRRLRRERSSPVPDVGAAER